MSERLEHWEGEPVERWREAWGVPSLEVWSRVGSTSDRALVLAAAGSPPFATVIADEQTAGRGRRGASWHSPPGTGLWMSLVLPSAPLALHLPLLVGLAVAEGVEAAGTEGVEAARAAAAGTPAGGTAHASTAARLGIKWPNDLLIGGRKVGGILCESVAGVVVAGIGLNVSTPQGGFPEALRSIATSLEGGGRNRLSRSDLAGAIVRALEGRLTPTEGQSRRGAGGGDAAPGRLDVDALEALRTRDVLLGRRVQTDEHGPGTAAGLDADGALLLEREGGSRVRVLSGSVRPL